MTPLAQRLRAAFPQWLPPSERPARHREDAVLRPGERMDPPVGSPPATTVPRRTAGRRSPPRLRLFRSRKRRLGSGGLRDLGAGWALPLLAAGLLWTTLAAGAVRASDAFPETVVGVRTFQVRVAAKNEVAGDARAADLYVARAPGADWRRVGACEPVLDNGRMFFEQGLRAPSDGVYYFTSSPVMGARGEAPAPRRGDEAQARVIVDTRDPVVEWLAPAPGFPVVPGQSLTLRWRVVDDNPVPDSVVLSLAAGESGTWIPFADGLPVEGECVLRIPPNHPTGPLVLLLETIDRAGHTGKNWLEGECVPPAPAPPVPPPETPPPPEIVAETPPPDAGEADAIRPEPSAGALASTESEEPEVPDAPGLRRRHAWVAYVAACNQVRQDRPRDALRYFREALDADPDLMPAWGDLALTYKEIGVFGSAREALAEALRLSPEHPALLRLRGEIEHAEGMSRLVDARDAVERRRARDQIDRAVSHYAAALDAAGRVGAPAEMALTYYRLGEICYHVNRDPVGARAYWRKILDLHAAAPDAELRRRARDNGEVHYAQDRYERQSLLRANLDDWQSWARALVLELDRDEQQYGFLSVRPVSSDPERRGRGDVLARDPAVGANAGGPAAADLRLPRDVPGRRDSGSLTGRGLSGSGSPLAPRRASRLQTAEAEMFSTPSAPDPDAGVRRTMAAARSAEWPGFTSNAKTPAWAAGDYGSRP